MAVSLSAFLANRVGLIQNYNHPEQWQYFGSKDNTADLSTRRSNVAQLNFGGKALVSYGKASRNANCRKS